MPLNKVENLVAFLDDNYDECINVVRMLIFSFIALVSILCGMILLFLLKIVEYTSKKKKRHLLFHRVFRISCDLVPIGMSLDDTRTSLSRCCKDGDIDSFYWSQPEKYSITSDFTLDMSTRTYHVVIYVHLIK